MWKEKSEINLSKLITNYIFGGKTDNNHTIAQSATEKQMFLSEHAL